VHTSACSKHVHKQKFIRSPARGAVSVTSKLDQGRFFTFPFSTSPCVMDAAVYMVTVTVTTDHTRLLKMTFAFPKVKWLQLTDEIGKFVSLCSVKLSVDFIHQISLKSVNF